MEIRSLQRWPSRYYLLLVYWSDKNNNIKIKPFFVSEDGHNEAILQSETSHGHGAECGKEMSIIRKRLKASPLLGTPENLCHCGTYIQKDVCPPVTPWKWSNLTIHLNVCMSSVPLNIVPWYLHQHVGILVLRGKEDWQQQVPWPSLLVAWC